jgi:hypothetical protein
MIAKQVGLPETIAPHRKTTILLCGPSNQIHSNSAANYFAFPAASRIQNTHVCWDNVQEIIVQVKVAL